MSLESIDPKMLGARLTEARKARGITQEAAASHLGCSRPTLIAIEKGTRRAKSEEIIRLAALYGRTVHELVRPGKSFADLQPHFRAVVGPTEQHPEVFEAIVSLQRFADNYARLEEITGAKLKLNYPPPVEIGSGDVQVLAEDMAIQERQRLGLGDQPVIALRNVLEVEVGLRIVYAPLPSKIAGMFAFFEDWGGVIAVNHKHPPERRRATMVHEYGHLLADRYKPGVDYIGDAGRNKPAGERFAESFAMAMLMPATSLRRRFRDVETAKGDFQVADLCRLSHLYYVSVEAMALRLESLRLINPGVRDQLKETGFQARRAETVLGIARREETESSFSDRYVALAVRAFLNGDISEEQLAGFLQCDRISAREIVEKRCDVSENGGLRLERLYSDGNLPFPNRVE